MVNGEDYYTRKADYTIKGLVDDIVELEQEDELNQSIENSTSDTRRNQVFAYMLEGHWTG